MTGSTPLWSVPSLSEDRRWVSQVLVPGVAVVAMLVVWWAAAEFASVPRILLPSPAAVVDQLATHPALYLGHAGYTLRRVLLGASLGVGVGVLVGGVLASRRWLRRAMLPYLVAARVTPKIAAAPLLLVYLGSGEATGLVFVSLIAFFPAAISALAGFDRTPERHLDLARSVDAGWMKTLVRVRFRHALPDLTAGIKQSLALAFVGAIVAEWIIGAPGLGYLAIVAAERVQPVVLLATLAVLFALGLSLYGVAASALRRLSWRDP